MRTSIRTRMLLALNVLIALVGLAVGWAGIELAGRAIDVERRVAEDSVVNAAGVVTQMRLPLSDRMMGYLAKMYNAEAAVGPADRATIISSSFASKEQAVELEKQLRSPLPRSVVVASKNYRLATAMLPAPEGGTPMRLYLLVNETQLAAAKQKVAQDIALATGGAIVVATILGVLISMTISRPVRRLADRMNRLADQATQEALASVRETSVRPDAAKADAPKPARSGGPAEIVRLRESFDQLLSRLNEARSHLARTQRLTTLGELSASVAHELRNPLSGIKMNAQVLAGELQRRGIADPSLELIIREIDRMDLYLQELLSLAGGSAQANLQPQPVRLDELAESVFTLVGGRCKHSQVVVERSFPAGGCIAMGQDGPIRQVIMNLMLNAMDAMPHGGAVRVSCRPGMDKGSAVRFEVDDTGGGVKVPAGADIFSPFVTTKSGGAGLGLHICRQIIARLGGRIGYDNRAGGATFWFELPGADSRTPGI